MNGLQQTPHETQSNRRKSYHVLPYWPSMTMNVFEPPRSKSLSGRANQTMFYLLDFLKLVKYFSAS